MFRKAYLEWHNNEILIDNFISNKSLYWKCNQNVSQDATFNEDLGPSCITSFDRNSLCRIALF